MMLVIYPVLVAVLGLVMWTVSANPKVSEAGRLLFFCGAFVLTFLLARQTFHLG